MREYAALTPGQVETAGLRWHEYESICEQLGRAPSPSEVAMFSVMWSEHCAYKHSRPFFKYFVTTGSHVLQGPGENAGVVEVVPGKIAAAFKVESHNHPSAVDPFHGAATGVGGIVRDIIAMGARPVAGLNALRFGPPESARARRLYEGVVAGIAHYGNCIGVPTVGGEVRHEPCYTENPLVNVGCLGLVHPDKLARSGAAVTGAPVLYAGARTGRDGIGGAAFASEELDECSETEDRSAVQIGDPFAGKRLIESTLEALATGEVIAIQDMGAAGITCATSEMSAAGNVGMRIDLDLVPLREQGMRVEDILLSESQERMMLVVKPESLDLVAGVFKRWGLEAAVVGEVTDDGILTLVKDGEVVVSLPPALLAEGPMVEVEHSEPAERVAVRAKQPVLSNTDAGDLLCALLATGTVRSKHWVYNQYDHMVQLNTVVAPGEADAAVLRLKDAAPIGLALSIDGNERLTYLDPYAGGAAAVCESTLNVACVGGEALALTDCLNFGNPERSEVNWELDEAMRGIGEAGAALRVPVVGGNCSLYNEAGDGPILPTPVVAILGRVDDVNKVPGIGFKQAGDRVFLVGDSRCSLGGALVLAVDHKELCGAPVRPDLALHSRLLGWLREAIGNEQLRSAHDVSDGGLGVAVAECCVAGNLGAQLRLAPASDGLCALFGEGPSQVVVSVDPERARVFLDSAAAANVPTIELGQVGGTELGILGTTALVNRSVSELRAAGGVSA